MSSLAQAPADLVGAYGACAALARAHYENFPVASRLLPSAMRPHVVAVYAFARIADDIADEGSDAPATRQGRLRDWQARLHHAVTSWPRPAAPATSFDRDALVLAAVAHSIRSLELPISLFDDLVSAFGQDITTTRYASWPDVFDYCRRSANPVGRLVLRIAGHRDDALDRSSDALCTALQLTNFWQDFGRDWTIGRLYVPREAQDRSHARESDLAAGRFTPEWTNALDECVAVTRDCFDRGRAVCDAVSGRLRLELRLTWLAGRRVLERTGGDVLHGRPALGRSDVPALLWQAARWRRDAA